ncbi:MAG: ATPase, T2SS/T4P/T4SS family, partial [bacterium]
MSVNFTQLAGQYRSALFNDIVPFWLKNSPDQEHGGFLTSLDRTGKVYDTDKFMWLQGRQVWTFSMLYNRHDKNNAWLEMAALGVRFMKQHGRDDDGNWYFALTRDGEPLVQPCNIFSDCFAAMGFSQYALAAGDDEAKSIALQTFHNIVRRQVNPKGRFSKAGSAARATQSLVMPMIMSNLAFELRWLLPADEFEAVLDYAVHKVLSICLDKQRKLLFESVAPDGAHLETFDGRLISPGHGIEATWFMMDVGQHRNEQALIAQAVDVTEAQRTDLLTDLTNNYEASFFYKAISKPQGIIILTGPTGSGKSTTLIAALYQVIDPTVNVLTIEEPVEYIIKGARQLKIGPKMSFEESIRGILRHDPDI